MHKAVKKSTKVKPYASGSLYCKSTKVKPYASGSLYCKSTKVKPYASGSLYCKYRDRVLMGHTYNCNTLATYM